MVTQSQSIVNPMQSKESEMQEWLINKIKPVWNSQDEACLELIKAFGGKWERAVHFPNARGMYQELQEIGVCWSPNAALWQINGESIRFGVETEVNWIVTVHIGVSKFGKIFKTPIHVRLNIPAPITVEVAPASGTPISPAAPAVDTAALLGKCLRRGETELRLSSLDTLPLDLLEEITRPTPLLMAKNPRNRQQISNRVGIDSPLSRYEAMAIRIPKNKPVKLENPRRARVAARMRGEELPPSHPTIWLPSWPQEGDGVFTYATMLSEGVGRTTRNKVYIEAEKLMDVTFQHLRGAMTAQELDDQLARFAERIKAMRQPESEKPTPVTPTPASVTNIYGQPMTQGEVAFYQDIARAQAQRSSTFAELMRECFSIQVTDTATTYHSPSSDYKYELFRGLGEDKLRIIMYRRCGMQWIKSGPIANKVEAGREKSRIDAAFYDRVHFDTQRAMSKQDKRARVQ